MLSFTCATARELTLTVHWALIPLDAVAVITAVPGEAQKTVPLPLTEATDGLLEDHAIVLFAGDLGDSLADKRMDFPSSAEALPLFSDIPTTPFPDLTTLTVQSAYKPLTVLARMTVLPMPVPYT